MSSDRWNQIETLLHSALECEPHKRGEFLDHACGSDAELRNELESLLACSLEAESFLKSPALEDAAFLIDDTAASSPGQRVGPYSILAYLGAGMGEVYLALDTRLGRRMALKILPSFFVMDEQRLGRFEHEARAASGLNHPNIVTIHEIGTADGLYFIAMEHVDGETLRSLMGRGRLGPGDLIDVGIQVASALAAAHAAGIVHRDIKPENLMLRPDGYLKVLDFGLAKLTQQPATEPTAPTLSAKVNTTEVGVVMGTTQYMSPEQARGLGVDVRTDLFSLGVVLYELIAGRPPFEGETTGDVIVSILQKEPPPLLIEESGVPAELARIVAKALQKDRQDRYQTSADMLAELRYLKKEFEFRTRQEGSDSAESSFRRGAPGRGPAVETGESVPATTGEAARNNSSAEFLRASIKQHRRGAIAALAMSAIAVAAAGYSLYRMVGSAKSEIALQTMRQRPLTASGKVLDAAISPDGKYIVYSIDDGNVQSLWLRQVMAPGNDRVLVPPAEARYLGATFSPDGSFIYYVISESDHSNGLFRVSLLGGASTRLIENVSSAISFSPDNQRFAFLRSTIPDPETALMIANADGTEERQLVAGSLGAPAWSPDGKTIVCVLVNNRTPSPTPLMEVRVEDEQQRKIDIKGVRLSGQLAWLGDSNTLVAVGTEQRSRESQLWQVSYPTGEIQRITNDLKDYRSLSVTTDGNAIVTVQSEQLSNIWIAPGGDAERATRITLGNQDRAGALCWTSDGRLVYDSIESGRLSVWIAQADGSGRRPLVDTGFRPTVSPDGRYIVFSSNRAGNLNIWRMDLDGGNLKRLTEGDSQSLPYCSPDSQSVVYTLYPDHTLWKVSIEGGEPTQLTRKWTRGAVISPDGRLMACWYRPAGARSSSQPNVAIVSSEGGDPAQIFKLGRSARPPVPAPNYLRWAADGRSVLYIDTIQGVSNIWSQPLDKSSRKQVTNFKADRIFFFDWSRDGTLALIRGTLTSDAVLITSIK